VRLRADATAKELVEHCRRRLASFKAPSAIHILDAIPRTATGKVQRGRMHDLLGG
jgi:acyl-CoA synthetase (AMP-forming)/AMP-acid ligase II